MLLCLRDLERVLKTCFGQHRRPADSARWPAERNVCDDSIQAQCGYRAATENLALEGTRFVGALIFPSVLMQPSVWGSTTVTPH